MFRKYCFALSVLALGFFHVNHALGQSLKKGFQALEIHDYFKAKRIFDQKKKKNTSIASFGLAQLYLRPQNIFQNVDSAFFYVQIAFNNFDGVKSKKQKKYAPFGFEKNKIDSLRQTISTVIFERTVQQNTEESYIAFINDHLWAKEIPLATFYRDSLAFEKHLSRGFSEDMSDFLNKYPTSVFAERAQYAFFQFQFQEETASNKKEDFEQFMLNFPENPFVKEADVKLFQFAQNLNTVKGYEKFIESYPKSAYRNDAWRLLYRTYIKNNGLALLNEFKRIYPNYPFMAELEIEQAMLNTQLFPVLQNNSWGFMDIHGKIQVQPKFDYVEFFSQGRAAAQTNELYGFIDVVGNWIIRPQFTDVTPFRFNLSVVTDSKGKVGVINLFGEWIIEPQFEDIQIINDDWLWVEDETGWILYQISKNKFGREHFANINEFVNGLAIVSGEKENALIDLKGNKLLSFTEEIERFGDNYLVRWNDSIAIVNELNDKILPYNEWTFGNFNSKGFTPFELSGFLGYVNADGKIVIPARMEVFPNWELFASFEYKHAKAYHGKVKKFGLIDQTGNWIVAAKYNDISFFSELIAVQVTDKWEYINKNGQRLNIGIFDRAESFVNGGGIVIRNGVYGLINERGEFLIPIEMRRLVRLTDEILRWEDQNGKIWLGDNQGKLIFDLASSKIDRIDDNMIRMFVEDQVYYYLIKEKRVIGTNKNG